MHETMNAVLLREAISNIRAMLKHTSREIGRNADVERSVSLAGKNVDAGCLMPVIVPPRSTPGCPLSRA